MLYFTAKKRIRLWAQNSPRYTRPNDWIFKKKEYTLSLKPTMIQNFNNTLNTLENVSV